MYENFWKTKRRNYIKVENTESTKDADYLAVVEGDSIEECKSQMFAILGCLSTEQVASKREVVRPKITRKELLIGFLFPIILLAASLILTNIFICLRWLLITINVTIPVFYILFRLKYNLLFLIKIYQRYAPEYLRLACTYEPSCSEYMVLAVKKHGLIRGVSRGIRRLRRCGKTDGGVDYP